MREFSWKTHAEGNVVEMFSGETSSRSVSEIADLRIVTFCTVVQNNIIGVQKIMNDVLFSQINQSRSDISRAVTCQKMSKSQSL